MLNQLEGLMVKIMYISSPLFEQFFHMGVVTIAHNKERHLFIHFTLNNNCLLCIKQQHSEIKVKYGLTMCTYITYNLNVSGNAGLQV
jgi:hypothetical protein